MTDCQRESAGGTNTAKGGFMGVLGKPGGRRRGKGERGIEEGKREETAGEKKPAKFRS